MDRIFERHQLLSNPSLMYYFFFSKRRDHPDSRVLESQETLPEFVRVKNRD